MASRLDTLLESWRSTGSPSTASEIDELSELERLDGRERLDGSTVAARQADWDKRLKRYDSRDLPRLAGALLSFGRRSVEFRLPQLHAKGRDPRLAATLTSWVETRPAGFQGQPTEAFWQSVLTTLTEIGDARQLSRLEAVQRQVDAAIGCHADVVFRAELPRVIERLRTLAAETPDAPQPATVDLTSLFAAVYAAPDSNEPRAVLADVLLERGDPRGELISLQLQPGTPSRATARRCRELVAAHGITWTGAMAAAVRKEGLEFRRGFVHACRLGPTPAAIDLSACLELATIETLSVATGTELDRNVWGRLTSLRSLTGHVWSVFLAPSPLLRLTRLSLESSCEGAHVVACTCLPALRHLRLDSMLHGPDRFPLWSSALGQTLTSVWVGQVFGELVDWRAWMQSAPKQVTTMSVGVVGAQVRLTLRRANEGFGAEVVVNTHGDAMGNAQAAVDAAVDAATAHLATAGLERCLSVELAFRPNTHGPGFPGTHLPPSEEAVLRLKQRIPRVSITQTPRPFESAEPD